MGHSVESIDRNQDADCDLLIQTGFAGTRALLSQIDKLKPYIIMEAPFFREGGALATHSSWGYNGLQGGAYRPTPPEETRWHPTPRELPEEATKDLIVGQKPTDHSLRGSDHVEWILSKRLLLPEADFRPHPLMEPSNTMVSIESALRLYRRVFIYTSTVGVDALLAGCEVHASNGCSLVGVEGDERTREEILHDLSWGQASHLRYNELGEHILRGYGEARENARRGLFERPRGKIDGAAICEQYYRCIV